MYELEWNKHILNVFLYTCYKASSLQLLLGLHCVMIHRNLEFKITDAVPPPPLSWISQCGALAIEYSLSVALALVT